MLTFQEFETTINEIKSSSEKIDAIIDTIGWSALYELTCEETAVRLLERLMNDKFGWISYWIYEQNFGAKWDQSTASEADGTPIYLKTTRQLYDYLVKEDDRHES